MLTWGVVRGDRKSVKEMAAIFGSIYGKEPQLQNQGSIEDLRKSIEQLKVEKPGSFDLMRLQYTLAMIGNPKTVLKNIVNDRYPTIKPTDVFQFYKQKKEGTRDP